jgi:cytochrome c-type biogenesis protein CcmH/NrfF
MLRWYGRGERRRLRPRSRLVGCLLWLIMLVVILIVLSLLFGGFRKGTKVSLGRPVAPLAAVQPASPPPRSP